MRRVHLLFIFTCLFSSNIAFALFNDIGLYSLSIQSPKDTFLLSFNSGDLEKKYTFKTTTFVLKKDTLHKTYILSIISKNRLYLLRIEEELFFSNHTTSIIFTPIHSLYKYAIFDYSICSGSMTILRMGITYHRSTIEYESERVLHE